MRRPSESRNCASEIIEYLYILYFIFYICINHPLLTHSHLGNDVKIITNLNRLLLIPGFYSHYIHKAVKKFGIGDG